MSSETAAYRLTRSKSNLMWIDTSATSCHDSLLLGSEKSMNSSSSLTTCYYNRSHSFSSSKNCSFTSGKYYSLITIFVCFLLFTFLFLACYSLEPPTRGFQDSSGGGSSSWQLGSNAQHLVITFPHTPFRALRSDSARSFAAVAGRSTSSGRVLNKKKAFQVADQERYVPPALQGMGQLFRRGRRAMSELVVAHLAESASVEDLRFFLRSLHWSGIPARADVVLLFPWRPLPVGMSAMIDQEDESFRLLLQNTSQRTTSVAYPANARDPNSSSSISDFNAAAYWKSVETLSGSKSRTVESVWGGSWNSYSTHRSSSSAAESHQIPWGGWGSVVGFDMQELDPGDSLRGFLDNPPSGLRRWVCYQILLGMVRHKFRNVLLTEAQGVIVQGDPLDPARRKAGSLFLFAHESRKWSDPFPHQQTKKISAESPQPQPLNEQTSTHNVDILQRDLISEPDHEVDLEQLEEGADAKDSTSISLDATQKSKSGDTGDRGGMLVERDLNTSSRRPVGLIEEIYGTEVWNGLEKEEKERKVLNTGVLMGGIRPMRSLANAMATEVVKVALRRKTREPFHDEAILNYLIIKSSVLRQKVKSHLHLVDMKEMPFHFLSGSNHTRDARPATGFQANGLAIMQE